MCVYGVVMCCCDVCWCVWVLFICDMLSDDVFEDVLDDVCDDVDDVLSDDV